MSPVVPAVAPVVPVAAGRGCHTLLISVTGVHHRPVATAIASGAVGTEPAARRRHTSIQTPAKATDRAETAADADSHRQQSL